SVELQRLGFNILEGPVPICKVKYQTLVVGTINRPKCLNLDGCIKYAYAWHFVDSNQHIALDPFLSIKFILNPISGIEELLKGCFHVFEDIPFLSIGAVTIDSNSKIQLLGK